jgi:secreted trypsin-like serine protease
MKKKLGITNWLGQLRIMALTCLAFCVAGTVLLSASQSVAAPNIIAGNDAFPGEFPFIAELQRKDVAGHWCGGVLVSQRFVATAAHCVYGLAATNLRVTLGEHDLVFPEGTEQVFDVAQAIVHPAYNPASAVNDIALLYLNKNATLVQGQVQIATLAPPPAAGTLMTIAGWGSTQFGGAGVPSEILQKADSVALLSTASCQAYITSHGRPFIYQQICAGTAGSYQTACAGDSGGPIAQRLANNTFNVVGLTSWGSRDCTPPAVYTQFQGYRGWINEWIQLKNTAGKPLDMYCIPQTGATNCSVSGAWASFVLTGTTFTWYSPNASLRLLSGEPLNPTYSTSNGTIRFGIPDPTLYRVPCPTGTPITMTMRLDSTRFPGYGYVGSVTRTCP